MSSALIILALSCAGWIVVLCAAGLLASRGGPRDGGDI